MKIIPVQELENKRYELKIIIEDTDIYIEYDSGNDSIYPISLGYVGDKEAAKKEKALEAIEANKSQIKEKIKEKIKEI